MKYEPESEAGGAVIAAKGPLGPVTALFLLLDEDAVLEDHFDRFAARWR